MIWRQFSHILRKGAKTGSGVQNFFCLHFSRWFWAIIGLVLFFHITSDIQLSFKKNPIEKYWFLNSLCSRLLFDFFQTWENLCSKPAWISDQNFEAIVLRPPTELCAQIWARGSYPVRFYDFWKIWCGFLLFWSFFCAELQMDRSRRLKRAEQVDFTNRSIFSRSWLKKTKIEEI